MVSLFMSAAMLMSAFTVVHADTETETTSVKLEKTITVYTDDWAKTSIANTSDGTYTGGNGWNLVVRKNHEWNGEIISDKAENGVKIGDKVTDLDEDETAKFADDAGLYIPIRENTLVNNSSIRFTLTAPNSDELTDYRNIPVDKWNDAKFVFDVWDSEGNYPTNMQVALYAPNGTGDGWTYTKPSIGTCDPREWNHVEVPLTDFKSQPESAKLSAFIMTFNYGGVNKASHFFFRNVKLVYDAEVKLTAASSPSGKSVNLTLTANDDTAWENYIIYRDGVKIAETTESTYTDKAVEPNKEYTYSVKSVLEGKEYDGETKTVSTNGYEKVTFKAYLSNGWPTQNLTTGDGREGGNNYSLGWKNAGSWQTISGTNPNCDNQNMSDYIDADKLPKTGKQTALAMKVDTSILTNDNGFNFRVQPNTKLNGEATTQYSELPSKQWNNAYLSFDVYDSENTNWPTSVTFGIHTEKVSVWPEKAITTEHKANEWMHVEIPLSTFANRHENMSIASSFNINFAKPTVDSYVFFSDIKIVYTPSVYVSAEADGKNVTLTITKDDAIVGAVYNVYRDGKLLAENTTETTINDTVDKAGKSYEYKVEAIVEGDKVAEDCTKVVVHSTNRGEVTLDILKANGDRSAVYTDGDNGMQLSPTYKAVEVSDEAPVEGGYSWKWNYAYSADNAGREFVQQYRFPDQTNTLSTGEYLEFMLYVDSEDEADLPKGVSVWFNEGSGEKGEYVALSGLANKVWNYVRIPATSFGVDENNCDTRTVNRIEIYNNKLTEGKKFDVYTANMAFAGSIIRVNAAEDNGKIYLFCESEAEDAATYKLFKNGVEEPLFTRTDDELGDEFTDIVTEYGTPMVYTLEAYDESGAEIYEESCKITVSAPSAGVIIAVKNNAVVDSCNAGDVLTVRAYGANGKSGVVMAAVYNSDNALVKAETVANNSFTVPAGCASVKFILVDNMNNISPLTAAKTVAVTASGN